MADPQTDSVVDPNPTVAQLAQRVRTEFGRRFGFSPTWMAAAPGRVNLIGEHTDYNDGFVLPMAIERYTLVAAGRDGNGQQTDTSTAFQAYSTATAQLLSWPSGSAPRVGSDGQWINYVWGVLAEAGKQGLETDPLCLLIDSSVPVGGGLSSSAALEVATATLLEAVTGTTLPPVEKALLCQKAEHDYAGMPCGIMDQFSSVMGREDHLILLDCQSAEAELVRLDDEAVSVLIINTNVKHELTGSEYADRRRQCEEAAAYFQIPSLRHGTLQQLEAADGQLDAELLKRGRHVVSEIQRTTEAAGAIRQRDWSRFGELMYASHASLRDDYEVSCDELDLLVQLAQTIGPDGGVFGARMTGGGFGGCTVSLVRTEQVETIARSIASDYQQRTGIHPTVIVSRPARGAHVVRN